MFARRPTIALLVVLVLAGRTPPEPDTPLPKPEPRTFAVDWSDGGAPRQRPVRPRRRVLPANDVRRPQCGGIAFGDPAQEARAALARKDYRVFTTIGFPPHDAPRILCPDGDYYSLPRRGGAYVSDQPGVCGRAHAHSDLPARTMARFNGLMAQDPAWQAATGCRAATFCEERYDKSMSSGRMQAAPDPRCPRSPAVLAAIAANGSPADLARALDAGAAIDGPAPGPVPIVAAVIANRLDNVKLLVSRGARVKRDDVNLLVVAVGASAPNKDVRPMLDFLAARGLDANACAPGMDSPLTLAANGPDLALTRWLLDHGARPGAALACARQTPLDAALLGAAHRSSDPAAQGPHLALAVEFLKRGGGVEAFSGGELVRPGDTRRALSILIAAKRRDGGEAELLASLLRQARGEDRIELVQWLEGVQACRRPVLRFRADHVQLCEGRDL
jgi:hypothetical protein